MRGGGELEGFAVPPCPSEEEIPHAGDRGGAGARLRRDVAIRLSRGDAPGDLQALAHRPHLREGGDIAEEVRDRACRLAGGQRAAESAEPRVRPPGAFGVRPFRHRG